MDTLQLKHKQSLRIVPVANIPPSKYIFRTSAAAVATDTLITTMLMLLGVPAFISQLPGLLTGIYTKRAINVDSNSFPMDTGKIESIAVLIMIVCLRGIAFATATHFLAGAAIIMSPFVAILLGEYTLEKLRRSWSCPSTTGSMLIIIGISVLMRLLASSIIGAIPEEAYYWNYSQHMAAGYLDHPPAVAVLIKITTTLLGQNSFALRLPAMICWLVTAFFTYKIAVMYAGKRAGLVAVAALSVIPGFFVCSFMITPDSPLLACWSGAIYFAALAIRSNRRSYWILTGACGGLGFLSKYTIGMMAIALLAQMLFNRDSRRLWLKPGPYLAIVTAALVAMPNILWNASNGWCSYGFQSTRRLSASMEFGLFELIGSILLLMGPLAFVIPHFWRSRYRCDEIKTMQLDTFLRFQMYIPLAILTLFSLFHAPKLNWSLPSLLPAVVLACPYIMRIMDSTNLTQNINFRARLLGMTRRAMLISLTAFSIIGFWASMEGPGLVNQPMSAATSWTWERMASAMWPIQKRLNSSDAPAYLVGMDKYFHTSELSWYASGNEASNEFVAGRGVFASKVHRSGLMWDRWQPAERLHEASLIMISRDSDSLNAKWIGKFFEDTSTIKEVVINGPVRTRSVFYYRIGYRFNPDAFPAILSTDTHITGEPIEQSQIKPVASEATTRL